eukprot:Gregarina_sp_Poly_1__11106@NODE_897_length_5808_cov_21_397318_g641_i0_p5_GENE_NODE_897_length_5808_cov_21_397318_g641_i0NODE_897_length_5808_cov_21_397318_g641_i0_p5_ORF_typecomplete_len178_score21_56Peptidase_S8/PF00082_22/1_6e32_NODE_897_length_5808_cov_21_397318_g641_i0436969
MGDASKCIEYGVKHGAKVISASWGGGNPTDQLKKAIEEAGRKGVLFVAGSGTSAKIFRDLQIPASYKLENVIAVTCVNEDDEHVKFCNWGRDTVHLGAPGDMVFSTDLDEQYQYRGGTSMATPQVAGLAALALAKNSHLDAKGLVRVLRKSVNKMNALNGITKWEGAINAEKIMDNA